MAEPTEEQRKLTGAVVDQVRSVNWDGDITPYIDDIVQTVKSLLAMDPERIDFATIIRDQAAKWSLAAWSEELVASIGDSGWSKLADRLRPLVNEEG